jgi:hypothetical protein
MTKKEVTAELNMERIHGWVMRNLKKVFNIEKGN